MDQIDYLDLVELVEHYNLDITAAELHGLITGSVCIARFCPEADNWIKLLVPYDPLDDHQLEQLSDSFTMIYKLTAKALEDDAFSFTPVLPDADASCVYRTGELASWCRGFILAYQQISAPEQCLDDDAREAFHDLSAIANAESDGRDDEEQEQALVELEEYVRISAQMIFEDLNPATTMH